MSRLRRAGRATSDLLRDIVGAEISPSSSPARRPVDRSRRRPYALQDFNLYQLTRYGFRPSKIAYLSWNAWHDPDKGRLAPGLGRTPRLRPAEIKRWLEVFLRRFFANQFKRSALPNGPKISSGGSLSPGGDWRMPSDASPRVWLDDLAKIPDQADRSDGGDGVQRRRARNVTEYRSASTAGIECSQSVRAGPCSV
jgi:NAD+ synthase (glutamine-hydrolysing)